MVSVSQIGIVYSVVNRHIRRIIVPDHNADLFSHLMPGESVLLVSIEEYQRKPLDELFAAKTGSLPGDPRCAIVHLGTDKVVGVVLADPRIDRAPEGHALDLARVEEFRSQRAVKGPQVAPIVLGGNVRIL